MTWRTLPDDDGWHRVTPLSVQAAGPTGDFDIAEFANTVGATRLRPIKTKLLKQKNLHAFFVSFFCCGHAFVR
jgi:hypothetical protein